MEEEVRSNQDTVGILSCRLPVSFGVVHFHIVGEFFPEADCILLWPISGEPIILAAKARNSSCLLGDCKSFIVYQR